MTTQPAPIAFTPTPQPTKVVPPPAPAEDDGACFTIEDMNAMVEDYESRIEALQAQIKDAEERMTASMKEAILVEEKRHQEEERRLAVEDKILDALGRFKKIEREVSSLKELMTEIAFAPSAGLETAEITGAHALPEQAQAAAQPAASADAMLAGSPATPHGQPGANFDIPAAAAPTSQVHRLPTPGAAPTPRRRKMSAFNR